MSDVERVLRTHHGVCTTSQLTAAGVSKHAIARAVECGRLERAHRGVFVDPGLPAQARFAIRVGGRLSCVSAAPLHGLRVLNEPADLHIEVPPHATRLRVPHAGSGRSGEVARVRLHWNAARSSIEGVGRDSRPLQIASLDSTLEHVLACLPELEALCVLDSAREHVEWTSRPPQLGPAAFARLCERLPANLRAVAERSITGSQSVGETVARERLRAAGISTRAQVALPGGYWADLLVGERLVFEVDGEGPHTAPGAFDRDRGRWAWLKATGFAHLSFSHRQVLDDWDSVETAVRMLVSRGEHTWNGRSNSGVWR